MRFLNSKLKIENTILQNIAKKYGTPAYCYSYKQLRENINAVSYTHLRAHET